MKITVYCGVSEGKQAIYREKTVELGQWMTARQDFLVYGGGKVGLMGILADTMLSNGGQVIGIMPTFLKEREIAHPHFNRVDSCS